MPEPLSPEERINLVKTLSRLPDPIFEQILIAVDMPRYYLPGKGASLSERSIALLNWSDSAVGCGVQILQQKVEQVISECKSSLADKPAQYADRSNSDNGTATVQIFLAHAKEDSEAVTEIYNRLEAKGYNPWMDKKSLLPGQNWRTEIPNAIKNSQLFIACLSRRSVAKQGYVQQEFKLALDELKNKSPGTIYCIPLRLDKCKIPDFLEEYQYLNYFEENSFERLEDVIYHTENNLKNHKKTTLSGFINRRKLIKILGLFGLASTGIIGAKLFHNDGILRKGLKMLEILAKVLNRKETRLVPSNISYEVLNINKSGNTIGPIKSSIKGNIQFINNELSLELVDLPGGSFKIGSPDNEAGREEWESPQKTITVNSFLIGRYPITQKQWRWVAQLEQVNINLDTDPSFEKGEEKPVEQVNWKEAKEFCERLNRETKRKYRLPTEAEWEYACRARTTTPFHFGTTITTDFANYDSSGDEYDGILATDGQFRGKTISVGSLKVFNKFGISDMHGNIWEWCEDEWHEDYETLGEKGNYPESQNSNERERVVRGGSWNDGPDKCRSASRNYFPSDTEDSTIGFRVVLEQKDEA